MFLNREQAGRRLAERLHNRDFRDPLVLAIPRGGVVVGAALARALGAELDVLLATKLRAAEQPELAIGAVAEDGRVYLNQTAAEILSPAGDYLAGERQFQLAKLDGQRTRYRNVRPLAPISGRSVIVVDDGIATGSTMIAALQAVKTQDPHELIAAVPVASPARLREVRGWCDELVTLLSPEEFWAIGLHYTDFRPVSDEQVIELLRQAAGDVATTAATV